MMGQLEAPGRASEGSSRRQEGPLGGGFSARRRSLAVGEGSALDIR